MIMVGYDWCIRFYRGPLTLQHKYIDYMMIIREKKVTKLS